jgi:triosephosphate isomerase
MKSSLYNLELKTIPSPIMLVSIAVPPYDNIGNGTPTTGNNPVTIPRFIAIYKKKLKANA